MDKGCGIGVAVGSGVDVGVSLEMTVGRGEAVEVGETDRVGIDSEFSTIPHALRIDDRMIQDIVRIFILFILSL